jgi:hypothetical protein
MRPSPLTRLLWWFQDLWDLSPLARLRRRLHEFCATRGAKVAAGVVVAMLVVLGFLAGRTVGRAPTFASAQSAPRVITVHQRVLRRVAGVPGTRWRLRTVQAHGRTVYAHGRTVIRPSLQTVQAVRRVTAPAGGENGNTRTVLAPVTNTKTETSTRLLTVTRPVTVVATTTVVSTKSITLPVTVTVTVP